MWFGFCCRSIRRLFLFVVAVSTVPALALIIWSGVESGRFLSQQVREQAEQQAESLSQLLSSRTEAVRATLSTLVVLPSVRSGDRIAQRNILREVVWRIPGLVNLAVVDADGAVRVSLFDTEQAKLSDQYHVAMALNGAGFIAGEHYRNTDSGHTVLPYAATVRNETGQVIGAIHAEVDFNAYEQTLSSMDLPEGSVIHLLDRQGRSLHSGIVRDGILNPFTTNAGDLSPAALWRAITLGDNTKGSAILADVDGIERFYAFRSLHLSPVDSSSYLHVAFGIPEIGAQAVVRQSALRNVGLMALAAILTVSIAALLAERLLGDRLKQLNATVLAIEEGDLSARTGLGQYPEELCRAGQAVDAMAAALQSRSRERDQIETRLSASLREKDVLLREVHHRVKNNMQLILSLVRLEADTSRDITHLSQQIEARIQAMASVHEMIYQSEDLSFLDTGEFIERLATLNVSTGDGNQVAVDSETHHIAIEIAIPLALASNELILNASKHGRGENGSAEIHVSFSCRHGRGILKVRDRGPGIFDRPDRDSESFGLVLVETLTAQMGGTVMIENQQGAVVTLDFPISKDDQ